MVNSTVIYRVLFYVAKIILGLFCRVRVIGLENLPTGAAVIYANHSHALDPVYIMFAAGKFKQICYMAKEELFRNPFFKCIAKAVGAFPVRRGGGDTGAIDTAVEVLKEGKFMGIFPEGTRTKTDGSVRPKGGFIRIAERAGVPLVPVYLERRKSVFLPRTVVFGRPMKVECTFNKETGRVNYRETSEKYMNVIWQLKDKITKKHGKTAEA